MIVIHNKIEFFLCDYFECFIFHILIYKVSKLIYHNLKDGLAFRLFYIIHPLFLYRIQKYVVLDDILLYLNLLKLCVHQIALSK